MSSSGHADDRGCARRHHERAGRRDRNCRQRVTPWRRRCGLGGSPGSRTSAGRGGRGDRPCETGDAKATPAFDLDPPVRYIHAVGPVWEGGAYGEADLLASCYRRSLQVADELSVRSIAFPAISTGLYGFPPEQAARIAVATIRSTRIVVEHVRFVAFDRTTYELLRAALTQ